MAWPSDLRDVRRWREETIEVDSQLFAPMAMVTVEGRGAGPIPDGSAGVGGAGVKGAPLDITFDVRGATGALVDVVVSLTGSHSWAGDLDVWLRAPDGSSQVVFSQLGAIETFPGSGELDCGANAEICGTYVFSDRAPESPTMAEAADGTPPGAPIPPGRYRASLIGGHEAALLTAAFNSLADLNGTWTLRVSDVGSGFTGSIVAATLTLATVALPTLAAARSRRSGTAYSGSR
jgi:hypothetical protein